MFESSAMIILLCAGYFLTPSSAWCMHHVTVRYMPKASAGLRQSATNVAPAQAVNISAASGAVVEAGERAGFGDDNADSEWKGGSARMTKMGPAQAIDLSAVPGALAEVDESAGNGNGNANSGRRGILASILGLSLFGLARPSASASAAPKEPQSITVPLFSAGSAYLVYYRIDSSYFRAVVDTGSPFLMIPGTCGENTRLKAGCYKEQGVPSGLEPTVEQFDGFAGEVAWRKAPFSFYDAIRNIVFYPQTFVFGVVDDNILSGPGGVFLGLIKETDSWIRPSFLGQTDVVSFEIDLRDGRRRMPGSNGTNSPSLTLSNSPYLSSRDYIPMTKELRRGGASVQHYVSKLESIQVNGAPLIPTDKEPMYAIFDTGVTGMVVSSELYDQRYIEARERRAKNLWGQVDLTFETARNNSKRVSAFKPLTLPFDPKATWTGLTGHVIVLGLAFLNGTKFTADIDDGRLWVEDFTV